MWSSVSAKRRKKYRLRSRKNREKRKNGKLRSRAGVGGQESRVATPLLPLLNRLLLKQLLLGFQKLKESNSGKSRGRDAGCPAPPAGGIDLGRAALR